MSPDPPFADAGPRPSLVREVWSLAWPAIAHMLLVTLMLLVSRAMAGRCSPVALASLQISATLVFSVYAVFTAFSAGTLAVVARSVGAGDREAAARAARASILFAIGLGLAVTLPIRIANGSLLRALFPDAGDAVLADAGAYLHIVLPVLPLAFVEAIAAASLQGAGDTRTPLYVATVGNIVNIALTAALMFGSFGLPRLGIRGAAIGHASALTIEGVLLTAALLSARSPIPIRRKAAAPRADRDALARVLRVSIPAFAEKLIYHSGEIGFIAMIGLLGQRAMAANQGLVGIEAICFLSADGFGMAAAALVAQKLGARREAEASQAGLLATGMAMAWLTSIGVVFAVAPRLLMMIFSSDPEIIDLGARSLYVAAAAQPFMAFATVAGMGLRGAGDTRTVLGVTFACAFIVRLLATYLFAIKLGYGLVGVWLGSTADWVTRSGLFVVAYVEGRWRRVTV